MLHKRVGASHPMHDVPHGGAFDGIFHALPVAAVLWAAIAGLVYLVI